MTLRLEDVEQAHIRDVLAMCQQDTQQAADLLGVSRATLYRKLKKME
jgi:transcriptional regulator with PAS, ATPase and Fis domain